MLDNGLAKILVCVAVLACLSTSGAGEPNPIAFGVSLADIESSTLPETAGEFRLARAAYDVNVFGAMASGTLLLEFEYEGERAATTSYSFTAPAGFEVSSVVLEADDAVRQLAFEEVKPAPVARVKRRAPAREPDPATERRKPPVPRVTDMVSEAIELDDGATPAFRSFFRQPLGLEAGRFRLVLPSVAWKTGSLAAAPPVRVSVTIHHDRPLIDARSPSHDVIVDFVGDVTIVEPVRPEIPPGQPFEISFALQDENQPTFAGYVRSAEDGSHAIEALLEPPVEPEQGVERPKQVLFVVDTSGSMQHEDKLVQARSAVRSCLAKLGDDDTFNIIAFDSGATLFQPIPSAAPTDDRPELESWLNRLRPQGGTQLLPGLQAALEQPADDERHRMIVVVTDGAVADEKEALALLEKKLDDGRLFVVGTGQHHRQETILRLAEYGRGGAVFAGDARGLETAVTELFDAISRPLGWDLRVDWGGADVEEIAPSRIPDLYAGRSVRVMAWVRGDLPSSLGLRMSTTEGERLFRVQLPPAD